MDAAGKHSGPEIQSLIRDLDRDPHKPRQRSMSQVSIHEIRWKDRRTEHTGYTVLADARLYGERSVHTSFDQNGSKDVYVQKYRPVVMYKYRIVKDNRTNQKLDSGIKLNTDQNSDVDIKQVIGCVADCSSTRNALNENDLTNRNYGDLEESPSLQEQFDSHQNLPLECKTDDGQLIPEQKLVDSSLSAEVNGVTENNKEVHSSRPTSATMAIGMYSASDPVHVPSADSRSAGPIGAARRQVGVVGSERQTYIHPSTRTSVENEQFSIHVPENDLSPSTESSGHRVSTPKSRRVCTIPASEPTMYSIAISRGGFSDTQPSNRPNQQIMAHQKATLSNMEWRPKSSQKSRISSPHSHCSTTFTGSIQVKADDLSEKFSQVNIFDGGPVVITEHLKVPDAERIHITFGNFGDRFDSINISSDAFLACENGDGSIDKSSMRMSVPISVNLHKNNSSFTKVDLVNNNPVSPTSDSSPLTTERGKPVPVYIECSSPKIIHSYADIGTAQSQDPSFSPPDPQKTENCSSRFFGYDQQSRDCTAFLKDAIDENVHQCFSFASETLGIQQSNLTMMPQQQELPPVSHMYPQAGVPHLQNFLPHRQIMTPIYLTSPMAMPIYPGNHAYLSSTNGNNCLYMPCGNSNVVASGLKYSPQHYKPIYAGSPMGYENYPCSTGYTVGNSGAIINAENADDTPGFKYLDNGLYVQNPQVETSNIWLHAPGECATTHPSPYGIPGQYHGGPHSSYPQHSPGSYHASLAASTPGLTHHLVHHHPTPGAPTATFQPPQLGYAGWSDNF